jgi:transcription antitermination factor NusG
MTHTEPPVIQREPDDQAAGRDFLPDLSPEMEEKLTEKIARLFMPAAEMNVMKQKEFLTEKEVSLLYSVSISTLRTERCRGAGPGYIKDGKRVLYPKKTLNEYLFRRFVKTDETLG